MTANHARAPLFSILVATGAWLGISPSVHAVPVITETEVTEFYSTSEIMTAKKGGGLPTQIVGGPSADASAARIAAPLKLPATVGGGHVIPSEPGESTAEIRMVLLFNAGSVDPNVACATPTETGAGKLTGGLDVFAALCRGDEYFSQAHLKDEAVTGIGDPRYARAMSQLFLALMPPDETLERGRDF